MFIIFSFQAEREVVFVMNFFRWDCLEQIRTSLFAYVRRFSFSPYKWSICSSLANKIYEVKDAFQLLYSPGQQSAWNSAKMNPSKNWGKLRDTSYNRLNLGTPKFFCDGHKKLNRHTLFTLKRDKFLSCRELKWEFPICDVIWFLGGNVKLHWIRY